MKSIYILIAGLLCSGQLLAQAGAGMKIGPSDQAYKDSLRRAGYPYRFPIWGAKAVQKGINLQYPVGAMLNLQGGSQLVNITDLQVGFNDNPMVPMDFVKFGEVKADMQSATARLDLWVLPFLDVYAIGGAVRAKTHVNVVEPFNFSGEADFKGTTFGLGTTVAGGYHGLITITDINHTWTRLDNIEGSIKTWMITPRLGYNFLFKNKPNRSIAVWVGATAFLIDRGTDGTVNLSDLSPTVDKDQLEKIIAETEQWYQALSRPQQKVVKELAQALLNRINGLPDDITIHYHLKKEPTSQWSMIAGAQYQFNHRWQVRTEVGFLGGRKSLLISGNYRWRW
ncbi:hypothetical protein SAMN05444266_111179 [Chitinophaga jiangningensis]|uniref:MetA-pathway of phenol degradation n=1 Tax=Chitinophaga jiangningensis TaxID=1419482 RepID=A0A1M7LXF7_9BACT|nr:hypothetical protein [Chitinophaga jiangningensis]SHM82464.1 hypothetical protein SAMN05444266_111179 [Chitinophaga jiangningensis]